MPCTHIPAGYRSIHSVNPCIPCSLINLHGKLRAGGGHINDIGSWSGICYDSGLAKIDLPYVFGIANHGDDSLPVSDALCYGIAPCGSLLDDIQHLLFGSRIDRQFVSCFHQVADHGFTHDSHTDKTYFFHSFTPLLGFHL